MTRISLLMLLCIATSSTAQDRPGVHDHEPAWSQYLAARVGGVPKHWTPDGARVDILTETTAWEVEWCSKWPEAFGQAAFYAAATDRTAGIWLLKRGRQDDEDYLQALATLHWYRAQGVKLEFRVENVNGQ